MPITICTAADLMSLMSLRGANCFLLLLGTPPDINDFPRICHGWLGVLLPLSHPWPSMTEPSQQIVLLSWQPPRSPATV